MNSLTLLVFAGPLVVANSSITTLSHWARLSSLNALGNTAEMLGGRPYSLVITGLKIRAAALMPLKFGISDARGLNMCARNLTSADA